MRSISLFIIALTLVTSLTGSPVWGQEDSQTAGQEGQPPAQEDQQDQAPGDSDQTSDQAPDAESVSSEEKRAEEAIAPEEEEQQPQAIADVVERTGLIGGKLQLEYLFSYAHISSNQLFIEGFGLLPILVVGEINVQKIRRDLFINTFSARYKLTDRLQVTIRIPHQYTMIRVSEASGIFGRRSAPANEEERATSSGLGDIAVGLNYQLFKESLMRPSMFLGMEFKARNGTDLFETDDPALEPPTGSGFNSLRLNFSANKSAAPALLFGSLSYAYAFTRENVVFDPPDNNQEASLVNYDPGNNFSISAGMAYSLNYKLSLNASYQQSVNFTTRLDGNKLPNSATNAISLRFGATWSLNDATSIDLAFNAGLSPDAPDVRVDLRIPWRF